MSDAADDALRTVSGNQYAHPRGVVRLRQAISQFFSEQFRHELDPEKEILVTSGANEGQYSVFVAFLEPGDEVILFEPYFDQYLACITFNGGKPVYVPLHPNTIKDRMTAHDWTVDFDELRHAITPRTKMILLNTPHNPVGKVFTRDELEKIAALAKEFNLLVMADEVYDCLVYDNHEHVRIGTLPGMWERTVTVASAGKAFSATGWRVGWLIGPASIIRPSLAACTRIVFSSNSPLQLAVAVGLEQARARSYFETQVSEYEERRSVLCDALDRLGAPYTLPQGSYFVLLDISKLRIPEEYPFPDMLQGRGRDFRACWFMAYEIGVSAIPVSEFYCDEHCGIGERFVRFAFCKDLETLRSAGERIQKLKSYLV